MKDRMGLPSRRFIAFLLLLIMSLSSCEQLGYLICPIIPSSNIVIPPAPYDEEIGDCSLVGKSEEIETWLAEMESIAESCRTNLEPNWDDTVASRVFLDSKVNTLKSHVDSLVVQGIKQCEPFKDMETGDPIDIYDDYTGQLKIISQNDNNIWVP